MQYTTEELTSLARAYLAGTDMTATRLGREAAGNAKLFLRMFKGLDILSGSGELASKWFDEQWPLHLPWPKQVSRGRRVQEIPTEGRTRALSHERQKRVAASDGGRANRRRLANGSRHQGGTDGSGALGKGAPRRLSD